MYGTSFLLDYFDMSDSHLFCDVQSGNPRKNESALFR